MSGLKVKRLVWTIVFFQPAGTIPWTEYIARYVPWPVQLVAYVALAVWLPFHFWRHDHLRKDAYARGFEAGHRRAFEDFAQQLPETHAVRGGIRFTPGRSDGR